MLEQPTSTTLHSNRLYGSGKKGQSKRKVIDFMTRKEWYDIVAPTSFTKRSICKTLVNKSIGNKNCADQLKGRVFEVFWGDLDEDEHQAEGYIKFKC